MVDPLYVVCRFETEFRHIVVCLGSHCIRVQDVNRLRGSSNIDFMITDSGWQLNNIRAIVQQLTICNMNSPREKKTRLLKMGLFLYG